MTILPKPNGKVIDSSGVPEYFLSRLIAYRYGYATHKDRIPTACSSPLSAFLWKTGGNRRALPPVILEKD